MRLMKKAVFVFFCSPLLFLGLSTSSNLPEGEINSSQNLIQNNTMDKLDVVTSPNADVTTVYPSTINGGPQITVKGNDYCKLVSFIPTENKQIITADYQYNEGPWTPFTNNKYFQTPGDYTIKVMEEGGQYNVVSFNIVSMSVTNADSDYNALYFGQTDDRVASATSQEDLSTTSHTLAVSFNEGNQYIDIQQKLILREMPTLRGSSNILYFLWNHPYVQLCDENYSGNFSASAMAEYRYKTYDQITGEAKTVTEYQDIGLFQPAVNERSSKMVVTTPYIPHDEMETFQGNNLRYKIYDYIEFTVSIRLRVLFLRDRVISDVSSLGLTANYLNAQKHILVDENSLGSASIRWPYSRRVIIFNSRIKNFDSYFDKSHEVNIFLDHQLPE